MYVPGYGWIDIYHIHIRLDHTGCKLNPMLLVNGSTRPTQSNEISLLYQSIQWLKSKLL